MREKHGRAYLKAVLVGAVVAAALDLVDPMVFYGLKGVAPIKIPQSIASGLLGRAAYSGGLRTAFLGLALHILIALSWATVFVVAAQYVPVLSRHAILSGLVYGLLIYVVMYYFVLPHSNVYPHGHPKPVTFVNNVAAMVFLVGLPISLANVKLAPRVFDKS
jgi:hypothetical protein